MASRIEKDGRFYRMRRGKLVEIPVEWVGRVTTPQTVNRRDSKLTGKLKRATKNGGMMVRYKDAKQQPLDPEL